MPQNRAFLVGGDDPHRAARLPGRNHLRMPCVVLRIELDAKPFEVRDNALAHARTAAADAAREGNGIDAAESDRQGPRVARSPVTKILDGEATGFRIASLQLPHIGAEA